MHAPFQFRENCSQTRRDHLICCSLLFLAVLSWCSQSHCLCKTDVIINMAGALRAFSTAARQHIAVTSLSRASASTGGSLAKAATVMEARVGQPSDPTDWFEVTQDRINTFAEATMDDQWIHIDPDRARDGPFGEPIAHGQLTLSILPFLPGGDGVGIPNLDGMKLAINYGWNKVSALSFFRLLFWFVLVRCFVLPQTFAS